MAVSKEIQYIAWCDECGDCDQTIIGEDNTRDRQSAIKEFRNRGWKVGKKCICPDCQEEPK